MERFNDNFDNFTTEMLDLAYQEFLKTDINFKEIQCYLDNNRERYLQLLNVYNDEDLQFITNYIDKLVLQSSCSNKPLYSTGYKHCIRLLKELSIL
ncbi:hypothetical protein PV797_09335 [Clostridiaceae bacterium M8S5]|nr:hypothetical protein PV797_09335 [Clostridiaceae bacterium M8S5]